MVSTYIDYNLVTRDMKLSLKRTSEQVQVSRETEYYKEKIVDVKSIDDFLGDYRLYAYAMKAHGLEDMTYATAFMRKVLESDLSDDSSYANQLTDDRYRNFASAFSFSQSTDVVQSDAQEDSIIGLYSQSLQNQDAAINTDTAYFNAAMDKVTNADQVWQNDKLKNYVFSALGLDPKYVSYSFFKAVITSDVNDSTSFVNTQAAAYTQGLQDRIDNVKANASAADLADTSSTAYKLIAQYTAAIASAPDYTPLAAAFNFQPDGKLASGDTAMTTAQKTALNQAYVYQQPRVTPAAALLNKAYFEANIGSVTSVADLMASSRMYTYVITSFGLPKSTLRSTLENILTSDLSDPASYANKSGGEYNAAYKEIAKAFNFKTDGSLASGDTAQTAAQTKATSSGYMVHYNDVDDDAEASLIKSYKTLIGVVSDVDDLLSDTKIMKLALTAFGLADEGDSTRKLKKVLTSDLSDPDSYANSLKDSRYVALAKAYNFNADGSIGAPTLAQSESEILRTASAYVVAKSQFGTDEEKTKAKAEASYYSAEMGKIGTLDAFLANRRLVDFVLTSAGIDPEEVTDAYVRKMFESDLTDAKSFINTESDTRYREVVASFNFNTAGDLIKPTGGQIQTRRGLLETEDLYYNQTLEETQGEDNAGVRLALYFKRMASGIGSAYDILADSALLQVIQTTFSIPEGMSNADVDVQSDYINRVLEIQDLHDPEKLEKLLVRFTALYDVDNNTDVSAAQIVLSGGSGTGISADTLMTLAQLRIGGA